MISKRILKNKPILSNLVNRLRLLQYRSSCFIRTFIFFVVLIKSFSTFRQFTIDRVRPKNNTIYDQEELGLLDFIPLKVLQDGKTIMKQHKAIICGLTRDNAKELPSVIKYIERTGSLFQDYRVIMFENDSNDTTKEILSEWALLNNSCSE
jgi:hypothetical protein